MFYIFVFEKPNLFNSFNKGSVLKKAQARKYITPYQHVYTKLKTANTIYKALNDVQAFQFLKFAHSNFKIPFRVDHPSVKNSFIVSILFNLIDLYFYT
tara:strand:+ start:68 stop:361 length:294 start_codon:yes stop_codon:yes gene_type:complete